MSAAKHGARRRLYQGWLRKEERCPNFKLEFVQAYMLSAAYLDAGYSREEIVQSQRVILENQSARTLPDLSPVEADHYSAEVREGIERIFSLALQSLEASGRLRK